MILYEKTEKSEMLSFAPLALKYEILKVLSWDLETSFDDIDTFYKVVLSYCEGKFEERLFELSNIEVIDIYINAVGNVNKISELKVHAEEEYSILKKLQKSDVIKDGEKKKLMSVLEKILSGLDRIWKNSVNENSFCSWGY